MDMDTRTIPRPQPCPQPQPDPGQILKLGKRLKERGGELSKEKGEQLGWRREETQDLGLSGPDVTMDSAISISRE